MSKNEISIYKKNIYQPAEILYTNTLQVTTNLMVQDLVVKLNKEHCEIIIAANCFVKIKNRVNELYLDGVDKGNEVRQWEIRYLINRAIIDSGYGSSLTVSDIQDIIKTVLRDVLTDFSNLTTQEVGIAFKNGCREAYGTYMGISARIFYIWLRQYTNVSKMEANKALAKIDKSIKIITEEEIQRREKAWLNYFFVEYNNFCKTGEYNIYDSHNLFYEYLKKLNLITNIKTSEKTKITISARRMVKLRYRTTPVKNEFHEQELLKMIEKITKKDKSVEYEVLAECKSIMLKNYLTLLKNEKIDLQKFIAQKKS